MFWDKLKTVILLVVLTFILLIVGFAIGGTSGLSIALIASIAANVLSYWYSDKIILKMYGAKRAEYSQFSALHDAVKDVATRASLKMPKIYVIDSENPNAFATGRNEKNATITVTTGLLAILDEKELKAVIAHEVGHIKNKDLLISTVSVILASAIAYLAFLARLTIFFKPKKEDSRSTLELIVFSIVAPISAAILRLSISRSREYVADTTGARIVKDPESLANALIKLESAPKIRTVNRAASNLFIINPFSSEKFSRLLNTHPQTTERVKRLRKMAFTLV